MTETKYTWRGPQTVSRTCVAPSVGDSPRSCKALPTLSIRRSVRFYGLQFEEGTDPQQNRGVHCWRHAPSLSILLARVIDAEQSRRPLCHFSFRTVSKFVECARRKHVAPLQYFELSIAGDPSERQDCFRSQDFHLALEVAAAVPNLCLERFILRRSATAGRRDVRVLELQP